MNPPEHTKGILTIAHGKPRYLRMAKALARSLKVHMPDTPLAVVTDAPPGYYECLYDFVIPVKKDFGKNVMQKVYIDQYSPFQQTLFIDADSLACGSLTPIFEAYRGQSFATAGFEYIHPGSTDDHWKVDFDKIFSQYDIEKLPKFNGGIYYFEKDRTSKLFFETARELMRDYKKLGIEDFRDCGPPDEIIYSVAMALHDQDIHYDHGKFMRTLFGLKGPLHLDTLGGGSRFIKNGDVVEPAIVHFASFGIYHPAYLRECFKLTAAQSENFLQRFGIYLILPGVRFFANIRWWALQTGRWLRNRGI